MKKILDSHRSLLILDELSRGGELSQRGLSDRLGIAVGLINSYLKNLVKKGHIKIKAIPPKRFGYYITPKGFKEKSELACYLLQNYTLVFREARKEFSKLAAELYASGVRKVCIVGADDMAEIAYLSLKEVDIEFIVAIDDARTGEDFFRTKVLPFSAIHDAPEDAHFIIASLVEKDAMRKRLIELGADASRLHSAWDEEARSK